MDLVVDVRRVIIYVVASLLSTGKNKLPERQDVDSQELLSSENKITF